MVWGGAPTPCVHVSIMPPVWFQVIAMNFILICSGFVGIGVAVIGICGIYCAKEKLMGIQFVFTPVFLAFVTLAAFRIGMN